MLSQQMQHSSRRAGLEVERLIVGGVRERNRRAPVPDILTDRLEPANQPHKTSGLHEGIPHVMDARAHV